MSTLAELLAWFYVAALTTSALTVAAVWVILYLVVNGNWRARVLAAVMTAILIAPVVWVMFR